MRGLGTGAPRLRLFCVPPHPLRLPPFKGWTALFCVPLRPLRPRAVLRLARLFCVLRVRSGRVRSADGLRPAATVLRASAFAPAVRRPRPDRDFVCTSAFAPAVCCRGRTPNGCGCPPCLLWPCAIQGGRRLSCRSPRWYGCAPFKDRPRLFCAPPYPLRPCAVCWRTSPAAHNLRASASAPAMRGPWRTPSGCACSAYLRVCPGRARSVRGLRPAALSCVARIHSGRVRPADGLRLAAAVCALPRSVRRAPFKDGPRLFCVPPPSPRPCAG